MRVHHGSARFPAQGVTNLESRRRQGQILPRARRENPLQAPPLPLAVASPEFPACSCITPVPASGLTRPSPLGAAVSPFLFLIRTLIVGFSLTPHPRSSHLQTLNVITSAKTVFPKKLILTDTGEDLGTSLEETQLREHHKLMYASHH